MRAFCLRHGWIVHVIRWFRPGWGNRSYRRWFWREWFLDLLCKFPVEYAAGNRRGVVAFITETPGPTGKIEWPILPNGDVK